VSFGEILNTPPDVKYKDVLVYTKWHSCCDPSRRDPVKSHIDQAVAIHRLIHE
jgi:hypothetical protein